MFPSASLSPASDSPSFAYSSSPVSPSVRGPDLLSAPQSPMISSATSQPIAIPQPASSSAPFLPSSPQSISPLPADFHSSRQLARNALKNLGNVANSSSVMKFSIDTALKLVPDTAKNLTVHYGERIVNKIDEKLDFAVSAFEEFQSHRNANANAAAAATNMAAASTAPVPVSAPPAPVPVPVPASASSASSSALATADTLSSRQLYLLYWDRLKEKFLSSTWYSRVDEILLQNSVVKAFTSRIRPGEIFFNTLIEEYFTNSNQEEFLSALKSRLGTAWDDRLAPLAKAFFTTAKAVSAIVGAGKFFGGALQLGKARVNTAIDDLLAQWDKVLTLTDDMMEKWLPEIDENSAKRLLAGESESESKHKSKSKSRKSKAQSKRSGEDDMANSDASDSEGEHDDPMFQMDFHGHSSASPVESEDLEESKTEDDGGLRKGSNGVSKKRSHEHLNRLVDGNSLESNSSIMDNGADSGEVDDEVDPSAERLMVLESGSSSERSSKVLVSKFGRRLRQRIPPIPSMRDVQSNVSGWGERLKTQLIARQWFSEVDEILIENPIVKAFAALVQPAEHFFHTALHLFQSRAARQSAINGESKSDADPPGASDSSEFVSSLRSALGSSWDDRLTKSAKSFFEAAKEINPSPSA